MTNILDDNLIKKQDPSTPLGIRVILHLLYVGIVAGTVPLFSYLDTIPNISANNGWLVLGFIAIIIFANVLVIFFRIRTTIAQSMLIAVGIFFGGLAIAGVLFDLLEPSFKEATIAWFILGLYFLMNIFILEKLANKKTKTTS